MRIIQWILILLVIVYAYISSGHIHTDCGLARFRCNNGECIDDELLCDGRADCTDSSDETENECKKPEILCPTSTFRCNYGACINGNYRCNGIQNCIDNSDETYCNGNNRTNIKKRCLTRRCKHDEYRCDNGQCIRITDKCDGIQNCKDGSDETFTLCGSCPPTTFRRAYGTCINSYLRCDGITNCADSSDEDSKLYEQPALSIRSSKTTAQTYSGSLPIRRLARRKKTKRISEGHLHSSNRVQKIIGGTNTHIKSVPFLVLLRKNGLHLCGASIINKQWVVTAAHCLIIINYPEEITLCSGSSSLNQGYVVHNVSKFIIHDKYNDDIKDYDIALVQVKSAFIYDDYTKAVVLPSDRHIRSNWGKICGWGYHQKFNNVVKPNPSNNLKCAIVPRVIRSQCKLYLRDEIVTSRMICYGFRRGGVDTCQGDSGGPIVNSDNILLGITSWGKGCGDKFSPGVYTDITKFLDWIRNITLKNT